MISEFAAEIVTDTVGLEALEPEWWELWRRMPTATPFQSPAWLIPWWRRFHPGALSTAAVRHRRRLVALAPCYIENAELRRLLPIGMSISDYLDVLIDPAFAAPAAAAIASAMSRTDGWDRWELEELAPAAAARGLPVPPGCRCESFEQSSCPVLVLRAGVDAVDSLLSSSQRRHLKLARNRATRRGEMEMRRVGEYEIGAFLAELCRLHTKRWAGRSEDGVLADSRVAAFHRESMPLLHDAGMAQLYLALLDATPVAAVYGMSHCSRIYLYLTGFDPEYAFESPGRMLLAHVVEEALRTGMQEVHFLRGREPYKLEWRPEERTNLKRSFVRYG
jgi:CelD/BcsL family acetyltransferase involved in cellulose biosynthesis